MNDDVVAHGDAAIRVGSKSFAAAARLFDAQTRDDAVMLYAWCRHCDDMIDGQTLGHGQCPNFREAQVERLAQLRSQTARAIAGVPCTSAAFEGLRRVLDRHRIPARYPLELLRGFEMDVERRVYRTMTDTLEYCYHVAGVVGVMMAMIMGVRDPVLLDRACDLGIALQLTNIARDVIADAAAERVYLPQELLRRHGIDRLDPQSERQRETLHAAALELLDAAERYYDSARFGLPFLAPRSAWAVAAAGRIYREIGQRLRTRGPAAWWQGRVSVTAGRKGVLLMLALADVLLYRPMPQAVSRDGLWRRPG